MGDEKLTNPEDDKLQDPVAFYKQIFFSQFNNTNAFDPGTDTLYLSKLFEDAPIGIALVNKDGKIEKANRFICRLLGYTKAELQKKNTADITHPQDWEKEQNSFHELKQGKTTYLQFEKRYIKQDGTLIWANLVVNAVRDHQNQLMFVVGMVEDITEKRKSQSHQKLMYAIANAMNASKNTTELYEAIYTEVKNAVNTRNFLIALYDYNTDEITLPFQKDERDRFESFPAGKTLSAKVLHSNRSMFLRDKEIRKLEETGEIERHGSPAKVWMGVPLRLEGQVTGIIVIQDYENQYAFDESDLELMEFISTQVALSIKKKEDEEKIRWLSKSVEQSPAAIYITNPEGYIEYVNKKFEQLTGYKAHEVTGHTPRILQSGFTQKEVYQHLWKTIKHGKEWKGELLNRKKDRNLFWQSISISPFKDEFGKISHFLAVMENITERKKMEEDLIAAKEKAQESDKLKTAFLANMSHEIRTPMNGILGFADLLESTDSYEESQEYIEVIKANGEHLLNLINDVIDISKIESGSISIVYTSVNLNEVMRTIYRHWLNNKIVIQNKLNMTMHEGLSVELARIKCDETRLIQILNNLISNAVKHTARGSIDFGYQYIEGQLVFYVRDTGEGIPEDEHDKIFERFIQSKSDMQRHHEGTGLGLSISKAFIELMGGEIWMDSEPGVGSIFSFSIPYEKAGSGKNGAKDQQRVIDSTAKKWNNKTILIAEDVDSNFELLNAFLIRKKPRILRARNGKECVELVRKHDDIDLVLMDIKMPEMDGKDATRTIRQFKPELPIIAQTAYAMSEDREVCLSAGCNDYIAKPIQKQVLYDMLDNYLR
ncbi:MAG: PAS domain S-box protein [Bacteroidales bacterium]|nr:PAS domain S-box protein [Bacteroidales bacterium]